MSHEKEHPLTWWTRFYAIVLGIALGILSAHIWFLIFGVHEHV